LFEDTTPEGVERNPPLGGYSGGRQIQPMIDDDVRTYKKEGLGKQEL